MMESERERGRIMTLWQGPPEKGKTLAAAGDKFAFSLGSQYIKYVSTSSCKVSLEWG